MSFNAPSLPSKLRTTGVVLYPPLRFEEGRTNFYFMDCREQLRFFLTYFSRIGYLPVNIPPPFMPGMYTPACLMSEDLQILLQNDIVQPFLFSDRTLSLGYGGAGPYIADLINGFFSINNNCGGGWAVCPPRSIDLNDHTGELNSIIMTFRNIFPSPAPSVPFEDIIMFREKNADVLQNLHAGIDDLVRLWGSDLGEIEFRFRRDLDRVEQALRDASFPFFKVDFSVTRALAPATVATVVSMLGCDLHPAVIAFAGGLVEFQPRSSRRSVDGNQYPEYFEYVYLGNHEISMEYGVKGSVVGDVILGICFPNNAFVPIIPDGLVEERSFLFQPPGGFVEGNAF